MHSRPPLRSRQVRVVWQQQLTRPLPSVAMALPALNQTRPPSMQGAALRSPSRKASQWVKVPLPRAASPRQ